MLVFGPVASRRFGRSLGIDLSPETKSCNFDCLYCELPKAERRTTIERPPAVADIVEAVRKALAHAGTIDVLTVTANGEPTLYPELGALAEALRGVKGGARLLILSNGSTVVDPAIRASLAKFDIVKLSLDSATEEGYRRLDRPSTGRVADVIEGMCRFRREFGGDLILEILLVAGINDSDGEARALAQAVREISPDRVDIGTIDRPPAYDVKGVAPEVLVRFASHIEGVPVSLALRDAAADSQAAADLGVQELEATIRRRPIAVEDLRLYTAATRLRLDELIREGRVCPHRIGATVFYQSCDTIKRNKHRTDG